MAFQSNTNIKEHDLIWNTTNFTMLSSVATKPQISSLLKNFWPRSIFVHFKFRRIFQALKTFGQRSQRFFGKKSPLVQVILKKITEKLHWYISQILKEANIIREFLYSGQNLQFFAYLRRNFYLQRFFKISKNLRFCLCSFFWTQRFFVFVSVFGPFSIFIATLHWCCSILFTYPEYPTPYWELSLSLVCPSSLLLYLLLWYHSWWYLKIYLYYYHNTLHFISVCLLLYSF